MTVYELRTKLVAAAGADGGWGYQPGQPAHVEPTALAVAALAGDPAFAAAADGGFRSLQSHANADGSYRLARGRPQAVWPTALVLFAHQAAGKALPAAAEKLLTVEGRVFKADPEFVDTTDIDLSLMGWPWAEGTFSWVEPTAWACLALRLAGRGDHPRVREGLRLLLDRAFDDGGVNYGNRIILGKATGPIPGPTAAMLVALQGVNDEMRVDAALGYLRTHARQTTDLEHLSWVRIALAVHDHDAANRDTLPELDAKIGAAVTAELAAGNGLGAGPQRLALAILALNTARNPFRIPSPPAVGAKADARVGKAGTILPVAGPPRSITEKITGVFRGMMVNGLGKLRPLPANSAVSIGVCETYDGPMLDVLSRQFSHFKANLPPVAGKRVVLKPNLVEYRAAKVINTDPRFLDAVIQLFQSEGAGEIVVAEGPGHWRNAQFLVNESGVGDVLRKHDVRFVDINHDEPVKTVNLGRCTGLEYLYLSRTVLSADLFVSLPKLKTHHWAGVTLSLKNLFGTLPGICYGWPKNELHWRGIPNSIVDIAATRTPHLAIVDGVVGMEGDGPLQGPPVESGVIVMGADLVAVDATCARLMRIPPERIPTIRLAAHKKLGRYLEAEIPQLDARIEDRSKPYEWPPGIEKELLAVGV